MTRSRIGKLVFGRRKKRKQPGRRKRLFYEVLERRRLLAVVTWDGGGDGTSFLDPLNWDTDTVPGAVDDAVINVTDANPVITLNGNASVNSLTTQEAITITNGAIFTVATTADISANVSLLGGTLNGGTWDTLGARRLFFNNSPANRLSGVELLDPLVLDQFDYLRLYNGTTFPSARLTSSRDDGNSSPTLAFQPGSVLPGNVVFDGPGINNRNLVVDGNGSLTIPAGVTVETTVGFAGGAVVGDSGDTIINQGTIRSQASGRPLRINGSFTNNGLLTLSSGGIVEIYAGWALGSGSLALESGTNLYVYGGATTANFNLSTISNAGTIRLRSTLNNSGETLLLDDNSGNWVMEGATIVGGTISQPLGRRLFFNNSPANRLSGVELLDPLVLDQFDYLRLYNGTIFPSARLTSSRNDGNSSPTLAFQPGSVLPGNVEFDGPGTNNRNLVVDGNGSLTIPAGVTVETTVGFAGGAAVGDSGDTIINQGTIRSQASGRPLRINGSFTNDGLLTLSSGGIVEVYAGWSSLGSGSLALESGTNLYIYGGAATASFNLPTISNAGAIRLRSTLNNSGQTLLLDDNSGTWVMEGGTIVGGTISQPLGKRLFFNDSIGNRLSGVELLDPLVLDQFDYLRLYNGTTFPSARLTSSRNDGNSSPTLAFQPGSVLPGNVVLDGPGTNNRNLVVDGNGSLTIPAGVTVETTVGFAGGATVGDVGDTIINQGTIRSQASGRPLRIGGSFTNDGLLTLSSGGIVEVYAGWSSLGSGSLALESGTNLYVYGGAATASFNLPTISNAGAIRLRSTLNNSGQTLLLDDNSGTWVMEGGTIVGGTISQPLGKRLFFNNSIGNRLSGVELLDPLVLDQFDYLKLYNGTTFPSARLTSSRDDVNSSPTLAFQPGSVLPGDVVFDGPGANNRILVVDGNGSLTIPTGVTVETTVGFAGGATVGDVGDTIINQGTIRSQASGRPLRIGGSFTNDGLLTLSSGGIVEIYAGWSSLGSGSLVLESGTNLYVYGGAATASFNLSTISNAGVIRLRSTLNNSGQTLLLDDNSGTWVMEGATIVGGTISQPLGKRLFFNDNISNRLSGVELLDQLALDQFDYLELYNGTTFPSARLTSSSGNSANPAPLLAFQPGSVLPGDVVFDGSGSIGRNLVVDGNGSLTIPDGVTVETTVGFAGSATVGDSGDTIINQGTIRSQASGKTIRLGTSTNFSGGALVGGTWLAGNGGSIRFASSQLINQIDARVVVDGPGSGILNAAGNDALLGFGAIGTAGDFTISGGRNLTAAAEVVNEGALRIGSGSTLAVSSSSGTLMSRSLLQVDGTLLSALVAVESGDLVGSGFLPGDVVAEPGSKVAPGNTPGILSTGNFDLQPDATLNIETGGTVAGTDYDQLNVTGTVTLAGELDIDIISSIVKGTEFTIINNDDVDPIVGTFAGIPEGAVIDNGYDEYLITYAGGDGNDVVLTALTDVRAVVNTLDSGAGSLRGELTSANGISDPVAVIFLIPGDGPHTISPATPLPVVNGETYIDATTQLTYSGMPLVEVEGSSAGASDGFVFGPGSDDSLLRGLVINRWQEDGVQIDGANNIHIGANYIGTSADGLADLGNGEAGVDVYNSRRSSIGGFEAGEGNLISGNDGPGVDIQFRSSATSVEGNWIGVDLNGSGDLGNSLAGVLIRGTGVAADAPRDNFIGQVGGSANVISGNDGEGVLITGAGVTGNVVVNNLIGLDTAGTTVLPNSREGVLVTGGADGNTVGLAGAGNTIAGTINPYAAVSLQSTENVVQANQIGTDASGTITLGGYRGVELGTAGNLIGGRSFGDGNTIRGMDVESIQGLAGNTLLANSIYDSGNVVPSLGIDLDAGAPAPPTIDLSVSGISTTRAGGTLTGLPGTIYRVEVFANTVAGLGGVGEAETYLGFVDVTTNASGDAVWKFATPTLLPIGAFLSATATSEAEGTSELSASLATRPSLIVNTTSDSGAGSLRQAISDANAAGGGDLIEFSIAGAGPHTISLATELPDIADRVIIDGRSEPDFVSAPVVELDGSPTTGTGFDFQGGSEGSSLLGMAIGGFPSDGVAVNVADVTIAGNFIGLAVSGTVPNANATGIRVLDAPRVQIGGSSSTDRNVVSGNTFDGIVINGAASAGSRVQGNLVGLSADESLPIPNTDGIRTGSAASILIGTDGDGFGDANERNVVAGNSNAGIIINGSDDHVIAGNYVGVASDAVTVFNQFNGIVIGVGTTSTLIGTDGDGISDHLEGNLVTGATNNGIQFLDSFGGVVAGNRSIGNAGNGVLLTRTSDVTVGGTLSAERNILSGNAIGVSLVDPTATNNRVFGNYIGLDETGTTALPNSSYGVFVSSGATGNFIGTDGDGVNDELEGNVIAGNTQQDIRVQADGNAIAGNFIATDASGLTAIGNNLSRIIIFGNNNRLGTDSNGVSDIAERNIIAGRVFLESASSNNTIAGNYFGVGPDGTTLLETPLVKPTLALRGTLHTVGGPAAAARNVFAGLVDFLGGDNITFQNNYVGLLPDGQTGISTSYLQLAGGASGNQIGGDADGEGNVISRVLLRDVGTDGNTLEGNLIGLNADGTDGLGIDGGSVIVLNQASGNFIGTPNAGNVISSAKSGVPTTAFQIGVTIRDAGTNDNLIQNNIIGLNPSGDAAIGNDAGIHVTNGASRTIIGGLGPNEGNVISASLGGSGRGRGIIVNAAVNTTIEGNLIGTDITGTVDFGNTSHGIQDQFGSTGTVIRGNVISGNERSGVTLGTGQASSAVTGETVVGNLIGTDITGQFAIPNEEYGVWLVGVTENTIGAPTPANRNVISGNKLAGILVNGNSTNANDNRIGYNYIGLNRDGNAALPNGNGIVLRNANADIESNVISGNLQNGIEIWYSSGAAEGAIIRGNIIGLDATGTVDFGGNGANGIRIVDSPNNLIGGTVAAARNIISGNNQNGIKISEQTDIADSLNNQIVGNYIGTDLTGTIGLGNSLSGISIDPSVTSTSIGVTVGGDLAGNVISGNIGDGITIDSASNIVVVANLIGTTATGIGGIPNVGNGITVSTASGITIGGLTSGQANRVAYNLGDGVRVSDAASLVVARGNEVFNNGTQGIDLVVDDVTLNDPGELDGVQNYPQLDSALAGSQTSITGSITSTANTTLQIDFYGNDAPDVSLYGEGQRYLGSTEVITDGAGAATFSVDLAAASFGGEYITATATSTALGTSEFSAALQANSDAPPTIVQDSLLVTIIDEDLEEATYGIPTLVVDEGQELSLTGDFADVDSSPLVTIDWGDGTTTTDPIIRQESFSARKIYQDDDPSASPSNLYPVLVRVTDADGSGSAFIAITVQNVDPVITESGLSTAVVGEGQRVTLAGKFEDPGTGDYHYLQVDWGDGTGNQQIALPRGNRSFTIDHVYADDGDYTVGYTLFDDDRDPALPRPGEPGFSYDLTDSIRVFNQSPTASINVESNAVQGLGIPLSATVVDPGAADTIRYEWLIEQGGEGVTSSDLPEFVFTPQAAGTYDVLLTVRDDEHASFSTSAQIEVANDRPAILPRDITLSVDGVVTQSTEEGKTVSLSAKFTDGGERDIHTATIDFGDGSEPVVVVVEYGDRSFSNVTHTYVDDPAGPNDNYLITVTVSDGTDTSEATVPFEVRNAAPAVSIQNDRITDTNVRLVANIDDAGVNDKHTIEWFVNGVQVPGSQVVSIPRPSGTSLDILFRATDEDGGVDSTTATFFVLDDNDNNVSITESSGQINVSINGGLAVPVPPRDQILVAAGGGNDLITVDPSVTANVQVDAGAGDDTVITAGGNDTLIGGAGSDELRAGDGDDVLVSVEGDDLLDGGLGNDEYRFIRFSDKQVIDDGGIDSLNFEEVEQGTGTADGITIDLSVEGTVQDVHSTGTITLFGQFENVTGSNYNDDLSGNDADNELFGGPGNDTLAGAAGGNTILGGVGDDTIFGGPGDESLSGGSGNDSIDTSGDSILGGAGDTIFSSGGNDTITGGEGNDYIVGGIGNSTIDGGDDSDTIFGGPGNETLLGGGGNDTIVGEGDSSDTIFGGPGSDSLTGGGSRDSIVGGDGEDTIFGGAGGDGHLIGGIGDDVIVSGAGDGDSIFGGPGNDSLTGAGGSDTIVGDDGNDTIFGGPGNESILGGGGHDSIVDGGSSDNDTIFGGPGNDSLTGSGGADTISGGEGNDTIFGGPGNESLSGGTGSDTIVDGSGSSDDTIFGGPGNDSLTGSGGADSIDGGEGDDTIYGGPGNETLSGGGGADIIIDGEGNDTIFGGPGNDSLIGSSGNDTISGGEDNDTIFGGPGNESLLGGSGNDTIIDGGGTGIDTIFGGPGNDSLVGGGGSDTIAGDDGDDTIFGGPGNESLAGGAGNDTIVDSGGTSDDTIFGGPGNDSLVGSGGRDTILGGDDDDTIFGGPGNESILGGSGNDTIVDSSGDGIDTIFGGPGNDSLIGGGGNDTIDGGDGDDTIFGGPGNESLSGGAGNDTIVDGGGTSSDTIYGGPGNDSLTGSGGSDTIIGGDGDDTIFGGPGNESIVGGSGNDTIIDGPGSNDTIFGGVGHDSIFGTDGQDSISGGDGDDTISGGVDGGEVIDGGAGNDHLSSGGGFDDTLFGAAGSDALIADGTSVKLFGDTDISNTPDIDDRVLIEADADITLTTSGSQSTLLVDGTVIAVLTDLNKAVIAGGPSDNRLDASGFLGDAALLGFGGNDTLLGGIGNDTLEGGAGNDSLVGGGGDDVYSFSGADDLGIDSITEGSGSSADELDFFGLQAGVEVDLSSDQLQTVSAGILQLQLNVGDAIEDVTGTVFSDVIYGNDLGNKLIGGGGLDRIVGGAGDDWLSASRTRYVYLDFDSATDGTDHVYTTEERNAIQARMEQDFAQFDVILSQTPPVGEVFVTALFNSKPIVRGIAVSGGIADRIGFRDVARGGMVQIDVNDFLGDGTNQLPPEADNFIALSSTIASHELIHMYGARHHDAFGAPGEGVFAALGGGALLPDYRNAGEALETADHLIASPASVRTTLTDALANPYMGEREALKMAYLETGDAVSEWDDGSKEIVATFPYPVQPLGALHPLAVPNTLENPLAANFGVSFDASATSVVGNIKLDGVVSESDFYSFEAQAGDLLTIEVLSFSLRSRIGNTIDSLVRVFDDAGNKIEYYSHPLGAFNDDGVEPTDSILLDLVLPKTGTFYVEVDTFSFLNNPEFSTYLPDFDSTAFCGDNPNHIACTDTDTGDYELLIYRLREGVSGYAGDSIVGGAGNDTLVSSSGNDFFLSDGNDTFAGPGQPETVFSNTAPILDPIGDQTIDEGQALLFEANGFDDDPGDAIAYSLLPADSSLPFPIGATIDPITGAFSWTPQQNGVFEVLVTVSDLHGEVASDSVTITVNNTDLAAQIDSISGPLQEGSPITIEGSGSDPTGAATTIALNLEVYRGAELVASESGIGTVSLTFAPVDDGNYDIVLTANGDNGESDVATQTISVANVDPIFDAGANELLTLDADGVFSRSLSFDDPGDDTWTGTVDFGDGSEPQSLLIDQVLKTFNLGYTYKSTGTYTVTVELQDEDGGSSIDNFDVQVERNTPPVANDDSASTSESTPVTIDVLVNDTDADNNILTNQTVNLTSPAAGTLTNNQDGTFLFDPDGFFESLGAGDTDSIDFVYQIVDARGETATASVSIEINGENDVPTISGDKDGAITEDSSGDTGVLLINDPDADESAFQPQPGMVGDYGTLNLNAAGNWSYTRTADLQSMNDGDVLVETFTVWSADGTASELITITISGLNDNASIGGDNVGEMTEDADGDNGLLTISDADEGESVFQPRASAVGNYGTFSIDSLGAWSYTRTADLQFMKAGELFTESFTVDSADGTASEEVTIAITGLNDAATISGDDAANITEDENVATGTLVVTDPDTGENLTQVQSGTVGSYGTFNINAIGEWNYTRTADLNKLNAGDLLTDSFTVTSADETASVQVTINISGVNDVAIISGDNDGQMTEDATGAIGVLSISDLDEGENKIQAQQAAAGTFGNFSIEATGDWTYARTADLNFLNADEQLTESFTVASADGTATEVVTITINGLNDTAIIGGEKSSTISEDDPTSSGKLSIEDPDRDQAVFLAQASTSGTYGNFALDTEGNWSYTRTSDLQSLNEGDVLSETFSVVSVDGSATEGVTVTINGLNDPATIIGETTAEMTEDEIATGGVLTANDVDEGENAFQPQSGTPGSYGSFSLDAAGNWSYTRTTDLQFLNDGDVVNDEFVAVSVDGSASQPVTITIRGLDEIAIIGDTAGIITEDDTGTTGTVSLNGVESSEATFQVQNGVQGSYGTFEIDAQGNWAYTRVADLQSMNFGDVLAESFTISSANGVATSEVVITITGSNDDAVIDGDETGVMSEDESGIGGILANSDPDDGEGQFQVKSGTLGSYGSFSIDAQGSWSYTRTANLDHLNEGDLVVELFTVVSVDGTASKQVRISINGLNDAASITGDEAGEMTEDAAGTNGTLVVNDIDDGEDIFREQIDTPGSYGSFSLDANGNWSYIRTADLNAMPAGTFLTDTFPVLSLDATASKQVTITITGLNDMATISGDGSGSLTEDQVGDSGLLTVNDADNGEDVFQPQVNTPGSFGLFSIDEVGTWLYVPTADLQAMNAGDVLTETFTVESADGTASQVVSVRIDGLNDSASISGDATGQMTEDDTSETGLLTVSDVDDGESLFQVATLTGTYGTFAIDAGGTWSYTITADLQALNEGDVVSDAFSVASLDGTATTQVTISINGLGDDVTFGQVIIDAIHEIEELVSENGLNLGEGNSLTTKLTNAKARFDAGRSRPAINQLNAFTNQVKALVQSGRLDATIGQGLLDKIDQAILLV